MALCVLSDNGSWRVALILAPLWPPMLHRPPPMPESLQRTSLWKAFSLPLSFLVFISLFPNFLPLCFLVRKVWLFCYFALSIFAYCCDVPVVEASPIHLQPSFEHHSVVDYSLVAWLVVICILTSEEFRAAVGTNDTERIQEVTRLLTWNSRGLDPAQLGPPPAQPCTWAWSRLRGGEPPTSDGQQDFNIRNILWISYNSLQKVEPVAQTVYLSTPSIWLLPDCNISMQS